MSRQIVLVLAFASAVPAARAQVHRDPTPQQQLQTTCNYEAGVRGLGGEEQRRFVAGCVAEGRKRQQQVLSACYLEARAKRPEERRAFMDECSRR